MGPHHCFAGRSREEAHRIGDAIAAAVTAANPPPVALKMEKVYLPRTMLSKKRYVGFAFESPPQAIPLFDAKGIETVRRDTCPAVAKIMERTLRILFTTRDLSQVGSLPALLHVTLLESLGLSTVYLWDGHSC